ncbi:hypothetical protein N0V88_005955 [Collariella sp. IMI 366227]|nr:hypothetical protein N0V88_005955 [Collariella sp. IMI 366227]
MHLASVASLLSFLALTTPTVAWFQPQYAGWKTLFFDGFIGAQGSLPSEEKWLLKDTGRIPSVEIESVCRRTADHAQLSGKYSLQLMLQGAGANWTMPCLKSTFKFAPAPGRKTMFKASVRMSNGNKAESRVGTASIIWLLGECGTRECGLITAMGMWNAAPNTVFGAQDSAGHLGPNRPKDHRKETITWYLNDEPFYVVKGEEYAADQAQYASWQDLAHNMKTISIEMSVQKLRKDGGETLGGPGSALEVKNIGVYESE